MMSLDRHRSRQWNTVIYCKTVHATFTVFINYSCNTDARTLTNSNLVHVQTTSERTQLMPLNTNNLILKPPYKNHPSISEGVSILTAYLLPVVVA